MIFEKSIFPFERFGEFVPVEEAKITEHIFAAGETLTGLAHRYYNDWREWMFIADTNNIYDPRRIEPGTILTILELPPETGKFESN